MPFSLSLARARISWQRASHVRPGVFHTRACQQLGQETEAATDASQLAATSQVKGQFIAPVFSRPAGRLNLGAMPQRSPHGSPAALCAARPRDCFSAGLNATSGGVRRR